eukprot:scaffold28378_cov223-Skeletonema_marinoi.AAC.15
MILSCYCRVERSPVSSSAVIQSKVLQKRQVGGQFSILTQCDKHKCFMLSFASRSLEQSIYSGVTNVGWAAFSKLLCDTSSINNTYLSLSNHSIRTIGYDRTLLDSWQYLEMTKHPHPAMNKILKSHPDFDVEPFFQLKLKLLPVVVNWFES